MPAFGATLDDYKRELNTRKQHPKLEVESYDTQFRREMVALKPKNYPFIDKMFTPGKSLPVIIQKAREMPSRTLPLMTQEIQTAELHLKSPYFPSLLNRNSKDMPCGLTNQAAIDQGIREYHKGDHASAVRLFSAALKVDRKNQFALFFRGMALERLRQYKRAMDDFSTFIRLYPSKPIPYYNRGICHLHMEEDRAAVQDFTSAIDFESSMDACADYFSMRGLAYRRQGNFVEAQKDYTFLQQINDKRESRRQSAMDPAELQKHEARKQKDDVKKDSEASLGIGGGVREPSVDEMFQDAMRLKPHLRSKQQLQVLMERSSKISCFNEFSTSILQQVWRKIQFQTAQASDGKELMTSANDSSQILDPQSWFVLVKGTLLIRRSDPAPEPEAKDAEEGEMEVEAKEDSAEEDEEEEGEEESKEESKEEPSDDKLTASVTTQNVGSLTQGESFDFASISSIVARSGASDASKWSLESSMGMPIELLVLDKESHESIFRGMIDEANADKVRMLVRLGIFAPPSFTKESVQSLMRLSQTVSFDAGQTITEQGELADAFYMLLKGSVKVTRVCKEPNQHQGVEVVVTLLTPGDIFGEDAILGHKKLLRYPSNARCNTSVKVLKFRRTDLIECCDELTRQRVKKQAVRYMADSKFIQAIRDHRRWASKKDKVIDRMITRNREIVLNKGTKFVGHSEYWNGVRRAKTASMGTRRRAAAQMGTYMCMRA